MLDINDYIDKIICGDCLEVMREIPDDSVDLVVTDPPYSMGIISARANKTNKWSDISNASYFYRIWYAECKRILKGTGAMWCFCNWRTIPLVQKTAWDCNWQVDSLLVWDKEWIGIGGSNRGLRHSYEMVALLAQKKFLILDRSIPDIVRFKWASQRPHGHPAEKPQDLVEWLISISCCNQSALILDPFLGSGTTAVAAKQLDRHYIGIEINPEYCQIAEYRLSELDRQTDFLS